MNISFLAQPQLKKPVWKKLLQPKDLIVPDTVKFNNDNLGDVFVDVKEHKDGYNRFRFEIENRFGKNLGKEIVSIDNQNKEMFGFDIFVEPEYRNNKFHFGELLRLFSIMTMKENNCSSLSLYSKDRAVYFHGKYKFEPNNKSFEDRNRMLQTIARDKSKNFTDLSQKAKQLESQVQALKNDSKAQKEICVYTNKLAKEYIERAIKEGSPEKNHPFDYGMYMILKKETVEQNKGFFNNLYKKHGIDYTI